MSSKYVRDNIKSFIGTDLPSENLIDLTAEFDNLHNLITDSGLSVRDPWLGIQFVGNEEIPVTVDATNTQGYYREVGVALLHVVEVAGLGVADNIIDRAETIRDAFRGQRIGEIVVLGVGVPNFEAGATLQFEGGYTSATMNVEYRRDFAI